MLALATSHLEGDGVIHFYLFLFLLFHIFFTFLALPRHEENHLAALGLYSHGTLARLPF